MAKILSIKQLVKRDGREAVEKAMVDDLGMTPAYARFVVAQALGEVESDLVKEDN